jgi:hypothetical protein
MHAIVSACEYLEEIDGRSIDMYYSVLLSMIIFVVY